MPMVRNDCFADTLDNSIVGRRKLNEVNPRSTFFAIVTLINVPMVVSNTPI